MQTALSGLYLKGRFVSLEPLEAGHAPALFAAGEPGTLAYFPDRPEWSLGAFSKYVEMAVSDSSKAAYAVRWNADGSLIGSTAFLDIRHVHRGVEIGSTWISRFRRGGAANPEMKLLMLTHAFEQWGANRVQLKCDARNEQSQAAIAKLGAVREGVLRKHMVLNDGFVRDTVMFSITASEWPQVRRMLDVRLAAFDENGVLR
jgi:RimJ/RimL family protein N-acetyltransferase